MTTLWLPSMIKRSGYFSRQQALLWVVRILCFWAWLGAAWWQAPQRRWWVSWRNQHHLWPWNMVSSVNPIFCGRWTFFLTCKVVNALCTGNFLCRCSTRLLPGAGRSSASPSGRPSLGRRWNLIAQTWILSLFWVQSSTDGRHFPSLCFESGSYKRLQRP